MKVSILAVLLIAASLSSDPASAQPTQTSATRARDVHGVALGMTIEQVRARMPLEHVAFETYRGSADGIQFDLGFTPAGRVFRIESTQSLGSFRPDAAFGASLTERLSGKYGPPSNVGLPNGPAYCALVQPVTDAQGETRPFTVMWANAMLGSDDRGVTLEIAMLDFRILWADQSARTKAPIENAARTVRF